MRYLRVELRRYASRRAVRASGALMLLGIVIASVIVFVNSNNSPDAMAFSDPRFHLESLTDVFAGLSGLLSILGLGLGATFIGAEWSVGTITTYLTWEPRRVVAFVAKAGGALVFVFLAALAVQIVLGLGLTPAAVLRGTMEGTDGKWLGDTAIVALKSSTLAAIFTGIGFAMASAGRNSAASLTVGFIYFAFLEQILRFARPNWARWLVTVNADLWIGNDTGVGYLHSRTRAIVTLVAYALILLSATLALFRRRDVT